MRKSLPVIFLLALMSIRGIAQSIHFSQYYNAPLLLNPANTALLPENDFRIGLNYRNQWSTVPVPYNTFCGYGDFKIGGNRSNENHNNWLGLGIAFFSDKAGDGNLSLSEFQGSAAYHLQMSRSSMLSFGISGSSIQRSVNFDKLIFDNQWDGEAFNKNMTTGEKVGILKTSYYTVCAGINLAFFPNENAYIKFGGGVKNITQPSESFYGNGANVIAYRPIANLDMIFKTGPVLIVNPSGFFEMQGGASELVVGSLFRTMLNGTKGQQAAQSQLILGGYMRLNDAVIGVIGYQYGDVQFMANYDFTISALAPYNASYGAIEFSIVYSRAYHSGDGIKKTYTCPRF